MTNITADVPVTNCKISDSENLKFVLTVGDNDIKYLISDAIFNSNDFYKESTPRTYIIFNYGVPVINQDIDLDFYKNQIEKFMIDNFGPYNRPSYVKLPCIFMINASVLWNNGYNNPWGIFMGKFGWEYGNINHHILDVLGDHYANLKNDVHRLVFVVNPDNVPENDINMLRSSLRSEFVKRNIPQNFVVVLKDNSDKEYLSRLINV